MATISSSLNLVAVLSTDTADRAHSVPYRDLPEGRPEPEPPGEVFAHLLRLCPERGPLDRHGGECLKSNAVLGRINHLVTYILYAVNISSCAVESRAVACILV